MCYGGEPFRPEMPCMPAIPTLLDFDALLAPIAGASPSGADPREDFSAASPYLRLRDLRAEARAAERMADAAAEGDAAPTADWRPVRDLATNLIARDAKDIEVACWLLEALLRTDGMAGFSAGARLIAAMADTFWDGLHPLPDDEDGLGRRLAPIAGLNGVDGDGTLIQPLRKLRLFERPDGSPVAVWQYRQSMEVAGIGEAAKRQQRIAAGVLAFDTIDAEARAAARDWAGVLVNAGQAALEAWDALGQVVAEYGGGDTPSSRVRDLLAEITSIAERYAPRAAAEPPPTTAAEATITPASIPVPPRIGTREDALAALAEISDYFRRTEPHSPLAYTLAEAVRRARLTWPELLEEVVPDEGSRDSILLRLGIRPNR
jgi:type VI secretion system protein ImpA